MELKMEVTTSRGLLEYININELFSGSIDEYDRYSFSFSILIYDENENVGEVHGRVFDESQILNDGEDLVDIADMYNQDVYSAIFELTRSSIYKEELDEDLIFENPYLCYIETVYIEPHYRRKGVAKYLFRNLNDILLYTFMIHIRCFVIYPSPQIPTEMGWVNLEDLNGDIKKAMIKVIEKEGYKQIGDNSNFYAINCMSKK